MRKLVIAGIATAVIVSGGGVYAATRPEPQQNSVVETQQVATETTQEPAPAPQAEAAPTETPKQETKPATTAPASTPAPQPALAPVPVDPCTAKLAEIEAIFQQRKDAVLTQYYADEQTYGEVRWIIEKYNLAMSKAKQERSASLTASGCQ